MKTSPTLILASVLLASCAASNSRTPPAPLAPLSGESAAEISPVQAVLAAAERPQGITGTFRMQVRGTGRQNGWLYLNSENDYRDQRNLTIALPPKAARELEERFGADPVIAMKGKTIRVNGTAQRTTIWFIENGERSNSYYYQTHVRLVDLSQIRILQ